MPARADSRRLRRIPWLPITTAVLVACSVDTSNITFQKDDVFERYDDLGEGGDGVIDIGGVANFAGVLNKAGSAPKAGSSTGGAPLGGSSAGGSPAVGGAPPQGGMGMGGMPPAGGYPCPARVKPDKLLGDFQSLKSPMDSWQDPSMQMTYGLYTYPPGDTLILKVGDGRLTGEGHQISQPSGIGIWFSPCVDGKSAGFSALAFRIYGSGANGQPLVLRFGIGSNANKIADPANQVGGCVLPMGENPGYCRPPATELMISATAPPGQLLTVPFSTLKDGSPAQMLDAGQIAFVEWGFIYLNGQPAYDASVVIDDVTFQ